MNDFVDHGTDVTDGLKVIVYKDGWVASRPWTADLVFADGQKWKSWQSLFRTRKDLVRNARAAAPKAEIIFQ